MLNMRRSNLLLVFLFPLALALLLSVPFSGQYSVIAQYYAPTSTPVPTSIPTNVPIPPPVAPVSVPPGGSVGVSVPIPAMNGVPSVQVVLTVSHGTLTVNPIASTMNQEIAALDNNNYYGDEARINPAALLAAAVNVSGNGTNSVTLSGPGSSVNVDLGTTVYQPAAGFSGVDQLVISANGTSGSSFSANAVVSISVVANSPGVAGQSTGVGSTASVGLLNNGPVTANIAPNTVTNGSVAVVVMAQNSVLLVPAGQFGSITLINQGIITAADVFGITPGGTGVLTFNASVNVCLQGTGRLYFLDATASPRVPTLLAATVNNGTTCATINHPGTLVLTH